MSVTSTPRDRVDYEPAESSTASSEATPTGVADWFPVNYLLIESLQKFHSLLWRGL